MQTFQVFLEEFNNMLVAGFAVRNGDALGCVSCNVDHVMKERVLQGL